MSVRLSCPLILRDFDHIQRLQPLIRRNLPFFGQHRRGFKRINKVSTKVAARFQQARLKWEREKRNSLRTTLIRQYEKEEKPNWSRNRIRLTQSVSNFSQIKQSVGGAQRTLDEDVQCGIFWDIENVGNE